MPRGKAEQDQGQQRERQGISGQRRTLWLRQKVTWWGWGEVRAGEAARLMELLQVLGASLQGVSKVVA